MADDSLRLNLQASEESIMSTTSSSSDTAPAANTFVELFEKLNLGQENPRQALNRMLSINSSQSQISTFFTLATEERAAQQSGNATQTRIGTGFCAEVFSAPGQAMVYKRAFPGWETDLRFDFAMHQACLAAFERHGGEGLRIYVSRLYDLVDANNDEWWQTVGRTLPKTSERRPVVVSERIHPLPEVVRILLISTFCDPAKRDAVINNAENRDALVRVYLGRRGISEYPSTFSLRNFELTLDMMDQMELPKLYYAKLLGQALAVIHWDAKMDGRDIEFVLGSAPAGVRKFWTMKFTAGEVFDTIRELNFTKRFIKLWVLDFNQCRYMSFDENGCRQAAQAFWANDPYYPRPTNKDEQELWKRFEYHYLKQAGRILTISEEGVKRLPAFFIECVKSIGNQRYPDGFENKPPPKGRPKSKPPPVS